ncbi:MAG: hypothetical protein AAB089_05875 [Nitrospirota bacterium]
MNFFDSLKIPLPRPFSFTTEYVLNTDLKRIFEREDPDMEKLKRLIDEAKRWSVKIDKVTIGFVAGAWINSVMEKLNAQPDGLQLIENIYGVMEILKPLSLQMDLRKAQNVYFSMAGNFYSRMQEISGKEDALAGKLTDGFSRLGYHLNVKI